jgi:hypothetical protein
MVQKGDRQSLAGKVTPINRPLPAALAYTAAIWALYVAAITYHNTVSIWIQREERLVSLPHSLLWASQDSDQVSRDL